jgi:hypothetical protein
MGWRDQLDKWEIADLLALEERLKAGYDEVLEYERRKIIARGHSRQTIANRRERVSSNPRTRLSNDKRQAQAT